MQRKENSLKTTVNAQQKKTHCAPTDVQFGGLTINASEKDVNQYMEILFGPDYVEKLKATNSSQKNHLENSETGKENDNQEDDQMTLPFISNENIELARLSGIPLSTIECLPNVENARPQLNSDSTKPGGFQFGNVVLNFGVKQQQALLALKKLQGMQPPLPPPPPPLPPPPPPPPPPASPPLPPPPPPPLLTPPPLSPPPQLPLSIPSTLLPPIAPPVAISTTILKTKPFILDKPRPPPSKIRKITPMSKPKLIQKQMPANRLIKNNQYHFRYDNDDDNDEDNVKNMNIKMPTSEEIWQNYMDIKEGRVDIQEAPWPISLMCHQNGDNQTQILKKTTLLENRHVYEIDDNEGNQAADELLKWQTINEKKMKKSSKIGEISNYRISNTMPCDNMEISDEEDRDLKAWIKSELLIEPLCDIEEYDMLLSMAREYDKNHDALFQLLKPKPIPQKCEITIEKPEGDKEEGGEVNQIEENSNVIDTEICQEEQESNEIVNEIINEANDVINNDVESPEEIENVAEESPVVATFKEDQDVTIITDDDEELNIEVIQTIDNSEHIEIPEDPNTLYNNEENEFQMDELADYPVILDIKDLGMLPPKPIDETAHQQWLQECSQKITEQLQKIALSLGVLKPNLANKAQHTDYEMEITKEQLKPRISYSPTRLHNHTAWQNKFILMLDDFEDDILQNVAEYRDPQAKRLRSKWNAQCSKTVEDLRRTLMLPALIHPSNERLQKIRILRRQPARKEQLPPFALAIDMKYVRSFCTIQLNLELDLNALVYLLDNVVYNNEIDVIQKRYEVTQIAWVWRNGTVMIINGRSQKMLFDTQNELLSRVLGINKEQSSQICNNVTYLRLTFHAQYPWNIDLIEFSRALVLSQDLLQGSDSRYVYYVNKDLSGVAARVFESGMIAVYAMNPTQADQMFESLYIITSKYRKTEITNQKLW